MLSREDLLKLDGLRTVLRALGYHTTGESRISRHLVFVEIDELWRYAREHPDAVADASS